MMNSIVESKRAQVVDLCRQHRVRRLELFGSAARDDFDEAHSDIDFLVELDDDPSVSPLDAYFGLKDALEATFGRPVDLVSMGALVNPYVMAAIERDRQLVYAA
jgi:uncharacterized protein